MEGEEKVPLELDEKFRLLRMEGEENKVLLELYEKVFHIFSKFMARIAKFEELVAAGGRFLVGFQQGLELLLRPPIHKTSEVVNIILQAIETKRVKSYVEAGCINVRDVVQNISKCSVHQGFTGLAYVLELKLITEQLRFTRLIGLTSRLFSYVLVNVHTKVNTCHSGLQDHISEAKCLLNELECLMEDLAGVIRTANLWGKHSGNGLEHEASSCEEHEMGSHHAQAIKIADFASMMRIIYIMVETDYIMQRNDDFPFRYFRHIPDMQRNDDLGLCHVACRSDL
ncbi:hypothetical protein HHK36_008228 [Tetracentron sinense]|uniref:DUF7795 domain-containing protein n=1 Tax=Tetracentron sinense TaxID=13715 RepID=A0A834ZJ56_TETSI|nr:hypothetical protein HHK36_008228 [Tetracentron sinense]